MTWSISSSSVKSFQLDNAPEMSVLSVLHGDFFWHFSQQRAAKNYSMSGKRPLALESRVAIGPADNCSKSHKI